LLANSISLYGNGITSTIQGQLDASDHAPFEWAGFEAALLIEGGVWSNPNYHSAADSVDTAGYIDYLYATNMTRSAVGYLATSAGLVPIPEPGSLLPVGSGFVWLILVLRRRARRAS
jgi:Zn-dependent M28 family amino/carboxypeptidase